MIIELILTMNIQISFFLPENYKSKCEFLTSRKYALKS